MTGHLGRNQHRLLVVAVGIVLAVPYGLRGPGYFREDWFSLENARFEGWYAAAGPLVAETRPGAAAVYAVVFGLLDGRVVAAWMLLVVLHCLTALLLLSVIRTELGPPWALAVTLVWVTMPNHTALTHWISTANISVAMFLALTGVLLLQTSDPPAVGRSIASAGCFIAAILTYEAVTLAAGLTVLIIASRSGKTRLPLAPAAGMAIGFLTFLILNYLSGEKQLLFDPAPQQMISANFGWGLFDTPAWRIPQSLLITYGLTTLCVMSLPSIRRLAQPSDRVAAAGLLISIAGGLPFAPYASDIDFVGLGDRANSISSIGAAMIMTGLGARICTFFASPWQRHVGLILTATLLLSFTSVRLRQATEWNLVWVWQRAVLTEAALIAAEPPYTVTLGGGPVGTGAVEGLNNASDASAALRWWLNDRTVVATLDVQVPNPLIQVEKHRPERLIHP
jgi:hypothetical protein